MTISVMDLAVMHLPQGRVSIPRQQQQNEPMRAVRRVRLGRWKYSEANGSTSSERIRSCCRAGPLRAVDHGALMPLQFIATANPVAQSSVVFHEISSYSGVKANRSSSHLCRVLSSAIEAHDLTLLPVGPSPIYDHSDPEPPQNDEPEGTFHFPVENLRTLLRLFDTDNNEGEYSDLLVVADYLERLGLDIYFRREIKSILDRVFRIWTEKTLSETATLLGDLEGVALAFFLLRSHQYDVQPRIFQLYRKEDGSFCKSPQLAIGDNAEPNATSADVPDLVNLLRASDLRFRSDTDLQDAYNFASTTLSFLLEGPAEPPLAEKTSAEIRHRLKYPWAINLRMMETRQTILNFQVDNVTTNFSSDRLSSTVLSLMLSTATRLVNHNISVFQGEIEDLNRWLKDSGLESKFRINDLNLLICYLSLAYEMPQAKYAYTREVHAKAGFLLIVMDDYYEFASSMEDVAVFNEAWRKWNPSLLEKLPKDQVSMSLRAIYNEMYNLTTRWAEYSSIWHGRDLLETFILTWAVRMEVYFEERVWVETGYKFSLQEYMDEFAKWSFAVEAEVPLTYYSVLGGKVSRSFAETRPDMETLFGISKTARFLNDARSYQHEKFNEGKGKTELIGLLMENNPLLTEKDAVEQAEQFAQSALQETIESFLRCGWPNHEFKSIVHQSFRSCILMYAFVDGLRSENWVLGKLMEPLPYLTNESM